MTLPQHVKLTRPALLPAVDTLKTSGEGMVAILSSSPPASLTPSRLSTFEKGNCRRVVCSVAITGSKSAQFHSCLCEIEVASSLLPCFSKGKSFVGGPCVRMSSLATMESKQKEKQVWLWTKSKGVMTASVERGWNTFVFSDEDRGLVKDWSSIALIHPLLIGDGELLDRDGKRVASFCEVSSPQQLQQFDPSLQHAGNVVMSLLDWQVIPAENLVAAFQGTDKTVFAVAKSPFEAQVFLEALEQGLGGVVLKVDDIAAVVELKGYLDRRNDVTNLLSLTKVTITKVQFAGMGDRVCVDLCSLMRPGEGLLVGSFARGLFLVHSECLESNYIASRPFRINAGPVHAYVAVPGGKTCYLSELHAGKEVIVVSQNGQQRTAIVGRVKIESRPLILVEAKENVDNETTYSIPLQNAETVGLVCPSRGDKPDKNVIPVTSLKVGDEVLLRLQGGARHTGIEIQEFIVEK